MTFVFYDTETTGLDAAFDQILQFAAIVTDDAFNTIEELNLRCRLQPHIVPSPGAIRITRVGPQAIQAAPLSWYEMVNAIRKFIDRWTPAIFIGFNSVDFDERMLRGALYQTLHPVYLTNTNGNSRMCVLRLAHAVAEYQPDAINVPLNEDGRPSFKLGGLIKANGLALDQAHEALADTRATMALARYLKERASAVWDQVYACRSRGGVEDLLKNNDVVLLTNRAFTKPTILAGLITRHPKNPASLAFFDLEYDPAPFLDVDQEQALALLTSSPRPIRVMRANALPILSPYRPDSNAGVDLATAREHLARIRAHPTFAGTIARAMAAQYADKEMSPHVENRIYDGFPSPGDQRLMDEFHNAPWGVRYAIARGFRDDRFRELAERLVFSESPDALPDDRRAALDTWRRERLTTTDKAPWLSLSRARTELADLKEGMSPDDAALLIEVELHLDELTAAITGPSVANPA